MLSACNLTCCSYVAYCMLLYKLQLVCPTTSSKSSYGGAAVYRAATMPQCGTQIPRGLHEAMPERICTVHKCQLFCVSCREKNLNASASPKSCCLWGVLIDFFFTAGASTMQCFTAVGLQCKYLPMEACEYHRFCITSRNNFGNMNACCYIQAVSHKV